METKSIDQEKIKKAIRAMATMRAAKLDQDCLRLYTARLVREHTGDVINALQKLAELPREDFETAVPEMATILELVRVEGIARRNRSEAAKSERMVRWECPDCKNTMTGFPRSHDDLERRCQSPYKQVNGKRESLGAGQICGAKMRVSYDESGPRDEGPLTKWTAPEWMTRSGAR